MSPEPRGQRVNNPTDIRRSPANTWIGQSPVQSDVAFVSFVAPKYCYRATTKIVMKHYVAGKTTIADVISHWAPPNENNTALYISHVTAMVGTSSLDLPNQLPELLHAITICEIGSFPYEDSVILEGIALAGLAPLPEPVIVLNPAPEATALTEPDNAGSSYPAPVRPAAIPWYQSNVIRSVLLGLVTQVLAHFKVADKFTPVDIASAVDYALQLISYGASAYAVYFRSIDIHPEIAITKTRAQLQHTLTKEPIK